MARSIGNAIADSLQLSLGYGERLLAGITAENFARYASPGGQTIESNHPAFVYGHLSIYPSQILTQLGKDAAASPEKFNEVFSKDARCADDPDGSIYPVMDEVMEHFNSGYGSVMSALREVSDDVLQQANPSGGRMTELFPTLGSLHGFYVGGHMMMHLGQLSAWRRMQQLGPA